MWSSEQPVPKCAAAGTIDNPTEGISDGMCLEIYQAWGWPYDSGLLQRHNLNKAIGEARGTATLIPPGDDIGVATGAHGVYIEVTNHEGRRLRIGGRTAILLRAEDVFGV
jgi:hypothetical protein